MKLRNFIKRLILSFSALGLITMPVAAGNGTIYFNHQNAVKIADPHNQDNHGDSSDDPDVIFRGARTKDVKSSRGGGKIAFLRRYESTGNYNLIVANANGSGLVNVTGDGSINVHSFNWEYHGSRLVFSDGDDLFMVNPDGTGETQLTNTADLDTRPYPSFPAGIPEDRLYIAFNRELVGGNKEVFVYNLGTGTSTNRSNHAANDRITASDSPWNSQGQLLFETDRNGNFDIYRIYGHNGAGLTRFTTAPNDDTQAAYAPGLFKIAFLRSTTNLNKIVILNGDGSYLHEATRQTRTSQGYVKRVVWAYDSSDTTTWLSFERTFVYTVNIATGTIHKVAHKTNLLGLDWSRYN